MNAPDLHFHSAPTALTLRDRIDQRVFNALYDRSLVYNTCWEDPAVDRKALSLGPDDTVMVISSAGCNALDGPARIHAVDANPRQKARCHETFREGRRAPVPYLPGLRAPYYLFVGATAWNWSGWTSSTISRCARKRPRTSRPPGNAWTSIPPVATCAATSARTSPPPSPPACMPSSSPTASKAMPA